MSTPYVPYGTAESFGQAANRLESERNDMYADYGYQPPYNTGYQAGRVVADTPNKRTVVYNNERGEWDQIGKWNDEEGGTRRLQKQDAKNAPRVQKNVDILEQNVAAATAAIVILIKISQPLLEPLTINLFVININIIYNK